MSSWDNLLTDYSKIRSISRTKHHLVWLLVTFRFLVSLAL